MTTLFTSENTFAGKIAELSRNLDENDVEIISVNSPENPNEFDYINSVRAGSHIRLKQHVIDELLDALAIEVNKEGRYTNSKNNVKGLTDTWYATKPHFYPAYLTSSVTFRGLRSSDAKVRRYQEKLAETKASYESTASVLIRTAIDDIQKDIEDTIRMSNEVTKKGLRDAVVELKVRDTEGFLNDEETAENNTYEKEQSEIDAQIAALKERKRTLDEKQYALKRKAITRAALNSLDTKGKAIVNSFDNEEREPRTDFSLFM
tara:strand:+ start:27672 stop:28457 length:786 start_codon:yes stop_codon:yes gene_type:complete